MVLKSRIKSLQFSIKRFSFFIPITWYFLLFSVGVWIGLYWLHKQEGTPDSAFSALFALLLRFSLFFGILLLSFSFITCFVPLIYFLFSKRKSKINFQITVPNTDDRLQGGQALEINISPILKPFLGFVKLRLNYDKIKFSSKFYLIKTTSSSFLNFILRGTYFLDLPEIKEYRVQLAIIYFEDFFQFFSFAIPIHTSSDFHSLLLSSEIKMDEVLPRKTEETNTRIEEIKRVEGEHINYKNFENNDDVRRIVWKIYAKNKELVVRIPEVLDPYASHIYFYPSFFSSVEFAGNEIVSIPFLNFYKSACWSVYKNLSQKGFEVRFVGDQETMQNGLLGEEEQVRYSLSVSKWQNDNELKNFVNTKSASIVVISSLSDVVQVNELLVKFANEISIIFVPLSDCMNKQHVGDWIQWLFVQQEKDVIAKYKTDWSLSMLRIKISKNEKQLKLLLEKYDKSKLFGKIG